MRDGGTKQVVIKIRANIADNIAFTARTVTRYRSYMIHTCTVTMVTHHHW